MLPKKLLTRPLVDPPGVFIESPTIFTSFLPSLFRNSQIRLAIGTPPNRPANYRVDDNRGQNDQEPGNCDAVTCGYAQPNEQTKCKEHRRDDDLVFMVLPVGFHGASIRIGRATARVGAFSSCEITKGNLITKRKESTQTKTKCQDGCLDQLWHRLESIDQIMRPTGRIGDGGC